ncbi:MAG TPA: hypothetical protein VGK17_13275 [Propionicimonas sp.]|jgi:hypothetical protein
MIADQPHVTERSRTHPATVAFGVVILAALIARIALRVAGGPRTSFDQPLDVAIFGSLSGLFVALAAQLWSQGRHGRAGWAVVGAVCWAVYTVLIVLPSS